MPTELDVQETIKERYSYEQKIEKLKEKLKEEKDFEKRGALLEEVNKIYAEAIFNYRDSIKNGLSITIFSLMEILVVIRNKEFNIHGFDFTIGSLRILLNDLQRCQVMLDGIHGPKKDKYPQFYVDPVFEAWKKEQNN